MNINILGKALLNIYKYLEPMTQSIDRLINTNAYNPTVSMGESVDTLSARIIALTERKIGLINIKVLIDKSIARLNVKNKNIIILRYITGMSAKEIVKLKQISMRTYFRQISSALDSFYKAFSYENAINNNLIDRLYKEKWFNNFLDYFDGQEKTDGLAFCNHLFSTIKQVS